MLKIVKSLVALCVISTFLSLPFCTAATFLWYFLFFSILQIIVWNSWQTHLKLKVSKIKAQKEEALAAQGVWVKCPCSKGNEILVPIKLNKNNNFKCLECKRNVSVDVQVKTFLVTEPLNIDAADQLLSTVYDEALKEAEKNKTNGV